MEPLLEIGTVCEDEVRRLAGQDSIVKVDSPTEVVSVSVSSMTTECVWRCRRATGGGGAMMIGGGIGKGRGESG